MSNSLQTLSASHHTYASFSEKPGLILFGVASGLLVAVLIPIAPMVGLTCALLALGTAAWVRWPVGTAQAITATLIASLLLFGYGFANVGVRVAALPIPLAELVLIALCLYALSDGQTRDRTRSLLPVWLFSCLVFFRLIIDYPQYGVLAIRDATLVVDSLAVLVGIHAGFKSDLKSWLRLFRLIFVAVLIYGTALPWRETLAKLGPEVGLQQAVPLLGNYSALGVATCAAFLFFTLYEKGWKRILLMSWTLAVIGLSQVRGTYLVLPLAFLVTRLAVKSRRSLFLPAAAAVTSCVVALLFVAPLNLTGRLGDVNPAFYLSHVGTLVGNRGPGSGSIDDRLDWASETINRVIRTPGALVLGLGLGPDLASGFQVSKEAVRKPHNDYLEVFGRLGFLGLGIFIWILVRLLRPVLTRARSGSVDSAVFCSWVLGSTVAVLLLAGTQPLLAYPHGSIFLFFLLGLASSTGLEPAKGLRETAQSRLLEAKVA